MWPKCQCFLPKKKKNNKQKNTYKPKITAQHVFGAASALKQQKAN